MTEIKLDLDTLDPKPHLVRLCGQTIEVYPPKLKNLVNLMNASQQLREKTTVEEATKSLLESLYPIIPDLKKDGIDVSFEQLIKLVEFVQEISAPEKTETSDIDKVEVPNESDQKKTD